MSDIGMILDRIGHKLVVEIAAKVEDDYIAGHTMMTGLIGIMAGEAWDGAADRLVSEIAGLRGLLEAGDVGVDEVAAAGSFKLAALTAERDGLATKLIAMQAALEGRSDEVAKGLNAQIWMYLMQTAVARMPSPPVVPEA